MANFRRNHGGGGMSGAMLTKFGLFGVIFAVLFYLFSPSEEGKGRVNLPSPSDVVISGDPTNLDFLPSAKGQVIYHQFYTLSYIEKYEQPEWVAYEMTRDELNTKHVPRSNDFRIDPLVTTKSATKWDYKRSGYDRGHLVPAGDMGFDSKAMSETFFMSNMSPQVHHFNGGVWRELEEQVRDWARKYKKIYVVSGPVLTEAPIDEIGKNKVAVPNSYYKVILDYTDPEVKGIGFVLPNEVSNKPLQDYAMSIDDVEKITGINFFKDLKGNGDVEKIEQEFDINKWKFSKKRYNLRVNQWNLR